MFRNAAKTQTCHARCRETLISLHGKIFLFSHAMQKLLLEASQHVQYVRSINWSSAGWSVYVRGAVGKQN